jgi:LAO/AO transport system kinase
MSGINPNIKRKKRALLSVDEYIDRLKTGDRYTLGTVLTLAESTDYDKRSIATHILQKTYDPRCSSKRIAVTGSPGVGKSTFIEAIGMHWVSAGHKVAVLAIDPSSTLSEGSILGDKTRMTSLSQSADAFVRPSPSGKTLGGISRYTKECIQLCEFAGYNHIIVETVGVGQSETMVSHLVDLFVLLILPGSGDEIQGVKRGIMELADLLIINKVDGDRLSIARDSAIAYRNALQLLSKKHDFWQSKVFQASSISQTGIDVVAEEIGTFFTLDNYESIFQIRKEQDIDWYQTQIRYHIIDAMLNKESIQRRVKQGLSKLKSASMDPYTALDQVIKHIGQL